MTAPWKLCWKTYYYLQWKILFTSIHIILHLLPYLNIVFVLDDWISLRSKTMTLTRGLPGTKYDFWLYYSNSTITDWLTWTASIITLPDAPSNLSIDVLSGNTAVVTWEPPIIGQYTGFNLKLIPLSEQDKPIRNMVIRYRDKWNGKGYE